MCLYTQYSLHSHIAAFQRIVEQREHIEQPYKLVVLPESAFCSWQPNNFQVSCASLCNVCNFYLNTHSAAYTVFNWTSIIRNSWMHRNSWQKVRENIIKYCWTCGCKIFFLFSGTHRLKNWQTKLFLMPQEVKIPIKFIDRESNRSWSLYSKSVRTFCKVLCCLSIVIRLHKSGILQTLWCQVHV